MEGAIGVTENGAIWISEDNIPVRVSPFIAKHLVLVLNKTDIVPTLHHAYKQIQSSDFDFGIFISRPFKNCRYWTVIGYCAQGALTLSLTVLLLK